MSPPKLKTNRAQVHETHKVMTIRERLSKGWHDGIHLLLGPERGCTSRGGKLAAKEAHPLLKPSPRLRPSTQRHTQTHTQRHTHTHTHICTVNPAKYSSLECHFLMVLIISLSCLLPLLHKFTMNNRKISGKFSKHMETKHHISE